MLVVKIELHSAITHQVTEVGRMYIANTGEGTPSRGDYTAAVCRRGSTALPSTFVPNATPPTRVGHVLDYPRLAYNVWRLITRACLATFPEEQTKPRRTDDVRTAAGAEVLHGLNRIAGTFEPYNEYTEVHSAEDLRCMDLAREWLREGLR